MDFPGNGQKSTYFRAIPSIPYTSYLYVDAGGSGQGDCIPGVADDHWTGRLQRRGGCLYFGSRELFGNAAARRHSRGDGGTLRRQSVDWQFPGWIPFRSGWWNRRRADIQCGIGRSRARLDTADTVNNKLLHGVDLAIPTLSGSVDSRVARYGINRDNSNRTGAAATIVGFGQSGVAANNLASGTRRAGDYTAAGQAPICTVLSNTPTNTGISAFGDSGGALFVNNLLAGVNAFVVRTANVSSCSASNPKSILYGTGAGAMNVAGFASFIDSIAPVATPEPATLSMFRGWLDGGTRGASPPPERSEISNRYTKPMSRAAFALAIAIPLVAETTAGVELSRRRSGPC